MRPSGRSPTAQQALLHLALIEHEDGGYDAARLVRSRVFTKQVAAALVSADA